MTTNLARSKPDVKDKIGLAPFTSLWSALIVGRLAGYPVAQAFAGHAPPSVTGRYLHATLPEIAGAVAVLTGEHHPLASAVGPSLQCPRRAER